MAKTITVYSTASCPYCVRLKEFLKDNKFPFTDKRVDIDQEAAKEMVEKSGQMGVPFTVITDEKGNEKGILGFDVHQLQLSLLS
ncbi:MAG: glutaredoxin 3 [Patescibacteria group bacterium]|nr:glutaredoxin 3 [Patescibacteria group bacterium]MDQ5954059.1 glutaredoxin 3 [Patescibacteria group bacterium]